MKDSIIAHLNTLLHQRWAIIGVIAENDTLKKRIKVDHLGIFDDQPYKTKLSEVNNKIKRETSFLTN